MKKTIVAALAAILVPSAAMADVTVKLPAGKADTTFTIKSMLISDMVLPRSERPQNMEESVKSQNGVLKFAVNDKAPANYGVIYGDQKVINFYTSPGDNLVVTVVKDEPFEYTVSGSTLMDGISTLRTQSAAIVGKYQAAAQAEPRDEALIKRAEKEYNDLFANYVTANTANPAALFAVLNLDGENFMTALAKVDDSLKTSPLYPIVNKQKEYVEKSIAADKRIEELQSGNYDAPAFTLKNLEGKDVSVSDFKGKWLIIDFWGSWCGWCIKGFPKLKDAYEQYQPELEILGVDCNEPEANWRKGVEKYKLPWVNVYNPEGTNILENYGVTGFPTKVIVNPEGKIANITIGEDPEFFDKLAKLINGK